MLTETTSAWDVGMVVCTSGVFVGSGATVSVGVPGVSVGSFAISSVGIGIVFIGSGCSSVFGVGEGIAAAEHPLNNKIPSRLAKNQYLLIIIMGRPFSVC
jgi:hypothetical protein